MLRRDFLTALAGAPLAAAGALRAHAQGTPAAELTYGQSVGVVTLDPAHGSYTLYPAGSEAALCIYDGLLTFAPDMKIIPQLAESWKMADDLKSCTLKLRSGAKFHDGTPVDVAAVKVNIERLMDKQRNATNNCWTGSARGGSSGVPTCRTSSAIAPIGRRSPTSGTTPIS